MPFLVLQYLCYGKNMKEMDIYLAGKVNSNETSIPEFSSELEERGHHVIEKWW